MNKRLLVEKIIAALEAELMTYTRSAKAAHAEATDEQSKAENKYDTRGLEASYLAQGQSRQAAELVQAIQQYELLGLRDFGPGDPIDLGAVVDLEREGAQISYFIGPRGGGTEVECEGRPVLVVTPQSPLGQQLAGRVRGEELEIKVGRKSDRYRIAAVR